MGMITREKKTTVWFNGTTCPRTIVLWFRWGFRFAFRWPFRVSSSSERAAQVNRFQKSILLIVQYTYLKSCSGDFILSRIWSSAQDHAVLVLLLNLVGVFISIWPPWSVGNVLYHSCTSLEGASGGGQPLNIFTWFIGTVSHPPSPSKFTPFCFGGFSSYEDILYFTTRCGLFREQIWVIIFRSSQLQPSQMGNP